MPDREEAYRPPYVVAVDDPDFVVRAAIYEDLIRLQEEAMVRHLNARWSSMDALSVQVEIGSMAFIAPLLRNGISSDGTESYRCHIWFVRRQESAGAVSLIDIAKRSLEALPEVSEPAKLKHVIRFLLDSHSMAPLA
jgi:hypothetical protein